MMEPGVPSSITQKQRWANELRAKGYAVLSPGEVRAVLAGLEDGPGDGAESRDLRLAKDNLREALQRGERRGA